MLASNLQARLLPGIWAYLCSSLFPTDRGSQTRTSLTYSLWSLSVFFLLTSCSPSLQWIVRWFSRSQDDLQIWTMSGEFALPRWSWGMPYRCGCFPYGGEGVTVNVFLCFKREFILWGLLDLLSSSVEIKSLNVFVFHKQATVCVYPYTRSFFSTQIRFLREKLK